MAGVLPAGYADPGFTARIKNENMTDATVQFWYLVQNMSWYSAKAAAMPSSLLESVT